jgi:hypothetical protein
MASGEALAGRFDAWDEWPLARREQTPRLGWVYHPDLIYRTAGYVTRMSGGVGGGRP